MSRIQWGWSKYPPTADQVDLLERAFQLAESAELSDSLLATVGLAERRSGLRDIVRNQRGREFAVETLGLVHVTNRTVDKAKGGSRSAAECAAYGNLEEVLRTAVVAFEADDELGNPDLRIVRLVARVRLQVGESVLKITVKRQLDREPHLVLYNIAEVRA